MHILPPPPPNKAHTVHTLRSTLWFLLQEFKELEESAFKVLEVVEAAKTSLAAKDKELNLIRSEFDRKKKEVCLQAFRKKLCGLMSSFADIFTCPFEQVCALNVVHSYLHRPAGAHHSAGGGRHQH